MTLQFEPSAERMAEVAAFERRRAVGAKAEVIFAAIAELQATLHVAGILRGQIADLTRRLDEQMTAANALAAKLRALVR